MIERDSFEALARVRKAERIAATLRGRFTPNDVVNFSDEQRQMAERISSVNASSNTTWGIVILILREQG